MINKIFPYLVLLLLTLTTGCLDDEDFRPALDENGLTTDITDLVPQAIIDEMLRLGMPINGGANPPDLAGTYLGSPFILLSSNRPSDVAGQSFADYRLRLYDQENSDLAIMADYINGPESGEGIGSFVVGDGCKFSVFVEVNAVTSGTDAQLVHVISGELETEGIRNMHFANFMIDNFGNPAGVWIENGEGRVVHDSDGFSERTDLNTSTWYDRLPSCPCELDENIHETRDGCGEWLYCEGNDVGKFHYGATYEIRWKPDQAGQAGQQCTYDSDKKLITSGIAAGSPDVVSPRICGGLINAINNSQTVCDHVQEDVIPWGEIPLSSAACELEDTPFLPCWQYLRDWPANTGNDCTANNPVADIQHMLNLVGSMTCYEVTYLMREAKDSDEINPVLTIYLLGSGEGEQLTSTVLIDMLEDWKEAEEHATFYTDDDLVAILDKAIANLQ